MNPVRGMVCACLIAFAFGCEMEKRQSKLEVACPYWIKQIEGAIQMYMAKNNRLPDSLDQLVADGELVDSGSGVVDPWGTPFVYEPKGSRQFEVYSCGPDRKQGTNDDIRGDN